MERGKMEQGDWCVVVCALIIFGCLGFFMVYMTLTAAEKQPATPASAVSPDYQVKIFYFHRLNVDTAEEIERRITAWLKENKAEPISITQSCGASIHGATENSLVVTVLYRKSQ